MPLSEAERILHLLEGVVASGEWTRAAELNSQLRQLAVPAREDDLHEYLERLKICLRGARAARTHLDARLHRLRAVAAFDRR